MFIRKSTRKYKDRTYTNYLLVESVRTPKGPRQKVVCSLGDLSPRPRAEWLKLVHHVEDALVGQDDWIEEHDPEIEEIVQKVREYRRRQARQREDQAWEEETVSVLVDQVTTERCREAGAVHAGVQFWRRLGMDEILDDVGLSERARTLACAMTMNRLIEPTSEHAMPDWIRRTALDDILGKDFEELSEDSLYRNLDRLHPNREAIETALGERERNLFNMDQTILLYDLTSTYFEGLANGNPKAKRGYSRDKRPDCKQVVVGLVLNQEGFPLAHEVFDGNVVDRQTVGDMLDLLDRRVGMKEGQTVVVDRGMAYEENLEAIRSRKLHYLVASRQPERGRWLAEFGDPEDFEEVNRQPSPTNPSQKKTPVKVKLVRQEGETYVLCHSAARSEKDRAIRVKHEKKLLSDLDKLSRRIHKGQLKNLKKVSEAIGRLKERYPRVAKYYHIAYDAESRTLTYVVIPERREKAEQLDGCYLLKTDRDDLTADEAWHIYIQLTRVETAFRNMKSPLGERPIFHQVERRTDTHIFLCVLAYHLLVAIEKTLQDQGIHTSWGTVRKTLSTHQVSTVVLPSDDGSVLRIRRSSTPDPQHRELYDLLKLPHDIITPRKTWTHAPRLT